MVREQAAQVEAEAEKYKVEEASLARLPAALVDTRPLNVATESLGITR